MTQERYPGLQVNEDIQQQKWEWTIQQTVWVLLSILLIAIVLGLLGEGPLSNAGLGNSESPLQMQYQRFMRYRSPQDLRLTIEPSSDTVRVMLDGEYAKRVQIQNIIPQPEQVINEGDALTFVFNVVPPDPMHVVFYIQPEMAGDLGGWIALDGNPRQEFSQFVYP